jgi:hypothetical protein
MIELLFAFIIVLAAYYLLIKGYFFQLCIVAFGSLGLLWFLDAYVPSAFNPIAFIGMASVSWATLSPVIVIILTVFISRILK